MTTRRPAHFTPGRDPRWPLSGVVIHYTAAGSGKGLAAWWANPASEKVSAHRVICRNGEVLETLDYEHTAWHAGDRRGLWKGKPQPTNVNKFTIGIELSNYGILKPLAAGGFLTIFGKKYRGPPPIKAPDHRGNERFWEPYSDEIVEACIGVLREIRETVIPDLGPDDIQGHSDVSPHRKFDPGPLFPWELVRHEVFGLRTGPVRQLPWEHVGSDPEDEEYGHLTADEMCYDV